jgi:hypothetical protein
VLKLDCRLLSALFAPEESPDELASDWTKLLTSLTSCEAGLPEHEELEELEVAVSESAELESDCALSAAIRLCMNAWKVAAMSDPELELLVVPDESLAEVELLEVAELVEELFAPTDASALKMAPMSPPPGGGGAPLDPDASTTLEVLPFAWLWSAKMADKAESGIESPELAIEIMKDTPGLKADSTDDDPVDSHRSGLKQVFGLAGRGDSAIRVNVRKELLRDGRISCRVSRSRAATERRATRAADVCRHAAENRRISEFMPL